jgi:pilus assembly protein Flp/PilA
MMNLVKCFINNDSGSTAVEYALIAGAIVVAGYAALSAVGTVTSAVFGKAVADLTATGQ